MENLRRRQVQGKVYTRWEPAAVVGAQLVGRESGRKGEAQRGDEEGRKGGRRHRADGRGGCPETGGDTREAEGREDRPRWSPG